MGMAGISTNRFGYGSSSSTWQQLEVQREKAKARREQYAASNAALGSVLSSVGMDQITGPGDLAAKAALKRIKEETAAKLAKNQAAEVKNRSVYTNKPPATQVNAGDAVIDMTGNTIKLSNGTMLDIKTGKPAGDYLTLSDGSQIDLKTGQKVINIVT